MAYGIEDLIAAGIPAALFPAQADFYQVGNGKLHNDRTCPPRNHVVTRIKAGVLDLRDKDLCAKCAQGDTPVQFDLSEAVRGARVVRDANALRHTEVDWITVADLEAHLRRTAAHDDSPNPVLRDLITGVRERLTAEIAAQRATLDVNVESWSDAAALFGISYRRDTPPELSLRLAELALPPYSPWGPRDGAWILMSIEAAVVRTLLAGHDWATAQRVALDWALGEIGERDADVPAGLGAVISDYLALWRGWAHETRAAHPDGMCVVVANAAAPLNTHVSSRTYHRLLAPAVLVENDDPYFTIGIVPAVVAATLEAWAREELYDDVPLVRVAGAYAAGDDEQTLNVLLRIVLTEPHIELGDALHVARGTTSVPV